MLKHTVFIFNIFYRYEMWVNTSKSLHIVIKSMSRLQARAYIWLALCASFSFPMTHDHLNLCCCTWLNGHFLSHLVKHLSWVSTLSRNKSNHRNLWWKILFKPEPYTLILSLFLQHLLYLVFSLNTEALQLCLSFATVSILHTVVPLTL